MKIEVRMRLRELTIRKKNEDSPDEPFLVVAFAKFDGATAPLDAPKEAEVEIVATKAGHGNLGSASDDVGLQETIPIPTDVGNWNTALHGFAGIGGTAIGNALSLVSTLAVIVVGLEEDATLDRDVLEVHRRFVNRLRGELNELVRGLYKELLLDPQAASQFDKSELIKAIEKIAIKLAQKVRAEFEDEVIPGRAVTPFFNIFALPSLIAQAVDPDDEVGRGVFNVQLPELLRTSVQGIKIGMMLEKNRHANDLIPNNVQLPPGTPNPVIERGTEGRYSIRGEVTRQDIREPPTLGAAFRSDGKIVVAARHASDEIWTSLGPNQQQKWTYPAKLGSFDAASGPALAISPTGDQIVAVARNRDHRLEMVTRKNSDSKSDAMTSLGRMVFATGPGVACTGDPNKMWVTGTGKDGLIYLSTNRRKGDAWETGWNWQAISGKRSLTTPAIACSSDGKIVHVATLDDDRRLLHLISVDGGKSFSPNSNANLPRQFTSAPSVACSADGVTVWMAALNEFHLNFAQLGLQGRISLQEWFPFESREFVSAPALACSADGKQLHLFGIDNQLRLVHRFSAKAGLGRDGFKNASWTVIGLSDFSTETHPDAKVWELFY